MITFVSGFQRCGSSLVCQMLHAGGLPVFHDAAMGYPSFETMRQFSTPNDADWIASLDGHAVKWLEPQRAMPAKTTHGVCVIWMSRDYRQQAKSAVKLLTMVGGLQVPVRATVRQFEASYRRDTAKAVRAWQARGPVRVITFERLLAEPGAVAAEVADFLRLPLDSRAMVAQVRPRPATCLPGFLEAALIAERDQGANNAV